jgi:Fe-S-cluster-containing dehydrogenase component/DMSO reductase anchor subunit
MRSPESCRTSGRNEPRALVDDLLVEQGTLTAVETFARAHERREIAQPRYRALLPAAAPEPGQQYAFEVDLDKCSGCKACVTACHSLNGLDDGEAWRDVGALVSNDWRRPFQQVVTTACHHCVEPGCLEGCPVLAYEKEPATGIVRHLDDQCIGCQYCVMMCPYDVPKYSEARGIVRKCDLCAQRLRVGEAPACVQACPNEAIRITVVGGEEVRRKFRAEPMVKSGEVGSFSSSNPFLPASPDPAITLPTTRFVSARPLPVNLVPAESADARLQPAHWPLVWMLVLTQLGAGAFAAIIAVPAASVLPLAVLGLTATLLGTGASVLHLGRPLKAWRSFLGLGRSWLSREIVVFGLFTTLAIATTIAASRQGGEAVQALRLLVPAAAVFGLAGVACSGMVYHATRRAFWRGARSVGRFFGTTLVLGLAGAWAASASGANHGAAFVPFLVLAMTFKLASEHQLLRRAESDRAGEAWPKDGAFDTWSLAQSAVLMRGPLGLFTRVRVACGLAGGVFLPSFSLLRPESAVAVAVAGLACCLVGELAERLVFFRAVVPPRMPVAYRS